MSEPMPEFDPPVVQYLNSLLASMKAEEIAFDDVYDKLKDEFRPMLIAALHDPRD